MVTGQPPLLQDLEARTSAVSAPGRSGSVVTRTIVRRLALGVMTLFAVSLVVFLATEVLPGDAATAILGRSSTPERLAALRIQLGLDHSLPYQYWSMVSGILEGHPGTSLASGQPVWSLVQPRLVNSLWLMAVTAVVAIPLAVALGITAAVKEDRAVDHVMSTVVLAAAAVPEFVLAIMLILFFATSVFHVLPPVSLIVPGSSVWGRPQILVLPVATLTLAVVPYVFRMTRAAMIEVLRSEYVEMARLKGVPKRQILFRHALTNAGPPIVQSIALTLAYLAGGVVVVEYVFGYAGIGQGLISAVSDRDIRTLQLIVLLLSGFYVVINLVADVVSILATPRLRTAAPQARRRG